MSAQYMEMKTFKVMADVLLKRLENVIERANIPTPLVKMYWKIQEVDIEEKQLIAIGYANGVWKLFTPSNPDDNYVLIAKIIEENNTSTLTLIVKVENALQLTTGKYCKNAVIKILDEL